MSKMINVPGTTDFIPLDDIINIKIRGRLVSKEELIIPTDSSAGFHVRVGSYAELEVVTKYIGDTDAVEDEDEDEEDVKPKGGAKSKAKPVEEKPEESEDKIAVILWNSIPLNENPILTEIDQSLTYTEMDEKKQAQVDVRVKKYTEYLEALETRQELLDKIANITPAEPVEEADESEASAPVEEEDDSVSTLNGITTLTPITRTPDEIRLKEINDFLEHEDNNQDKQTKRIEYLEKHFNKSQIELEENDGYTFVKVLKNHNLGNAELEILRDAVREVIQEVSELVG